MMDYALCFLMEVVFYTTARLLLPLLSFGQIRVEQVAENGIAYNWLGLGRDARNQRVLEYTAASWLGLFLWMGVLTAALLVLR